MWQFLKRLLGVDTSRCRCASPGHGHAPGRCRNDATRSGGLCASCFEHVAHRFHDSHWRGSLEPLLSLELVTANDNPTAEDLPTTGTE